MHNKSNSSGINGNSVNSKICELSSPIHIFESPRCMSSVNGSEFLVDFTECAGLDKTRTKRPWACMSLPFCRSSPKSHRIMLDNFWLEMRVYEAIAQSTTSPSLFSHTFHATSAHSAAAQAEYRIFWLYE